VRLCDHRPFIWLLNSVLDVPCDDHKGNPVFKPKLVSYYMHGLYIVTGFDKTQR